MSKSYKKKRKEVDPENTSEESTLSKKELYDLEKKKKQEKKEKEKKKQQKKNKVKKKASTNLGVKIFAIIMLVLMIGSVIATALTYVNFS